jgi:hypothetical protein
MIDGVERMVVLGRGAAGKSTVAAQLGRVTALPVIELDKRSGPSTSIRWNLATGLACSGLWPLGTVEVVKIKVSVELGGTMVDSIDDHSTCTELSPSAYTSAKSVDEKVPAEAVALLGLVDGQPGKQNDRHRIRHSVPQPRRRISVDHGAHRQRVVADYPLLSTQHIGRCGPGRAYVHALSSAAYLQAIA